MKYTVGDILVYVGQIGQTGQLGIYEVEVVGLFVDILHYQVKILFNRSTASYKDSGYLKCVYETELLPLDWVTPNGANTSMPSINQNLTVWSIGQKVTIKKPSDPTAVGAEFAGEIGTIIETPNLFSDTFEIELGSYHNFQRLICTDDQFEALNVPDKYAHLSPTEKNRKEEGLCPKCGEKGYFSHFAFVCTRHGEY